MTDCAEPTIGKDPRSPAPPPPLARIVQQQLSLQFSPLTLFPAGTPLRSFSSPAKISHSGCSSLQKTQMFRFMFPCCLLFLPRPLTRRVDAHPIVL